eukprot:TRINITY_DN60773_c0_g1_i1.p1 TRINITY_DN60773_c0_g1~~TRINITY_DN60773_c0_g1_i1.p1  ORF type:complete len:292 (-),score=66.76 TRINITY_DN60773_c0_g1_i1:41-916(-)
MARKRQEYCVAAGGMLLLGAGLLLLTSWKTLQASPAQAFQGHMCEVLFMSGVACLPLGVLGAVAGCCKHRCLLCFYSWAALGLSTACTASSTLLSLQASSGATQLEMDCQKVQAGEPLGPVAQAPQQAYDGMQADLNFCRQSDGQILGLDACPNAPESLGNRWRTSQWWDVLKGAEATYGCSGFCEDGPSLFALPVGSVTEANVLTPRPACFSPLMQEVRSKAMLGCLSLLVASLLLVLPTCCACWLACAPPPSQRANYVHRPEELQWTSVADQAVDEENEESERLLNDET